MTAYADGDDGAFDVLFDALAPRLLAFFRCSFEPGTADDLLQTTFVRMHAARRSYTKGLPVRPWVFTIAARVKLDELRRRYRRPTTGDDSVLDALEAEPRDAVAQLDQDARDSQVRRAVDALPAGQRVVVQLHRFENLTFAQIGAVLGVQEGTVRVRAFRAYQALRTALAPLVRGENHS